MFDFVEDVIPTTYGKQIPNPFPPQIEKIKGTEKSITFTVVRTDDLPKDKDRSVLIERYKRQLQTAGRELGVTVQTKVVGDPKSEDADVKMTFWTVPMIVRNSRKSKTNGQESVVMETPEGTEPVFDTEQSADEAAEAEALEGIAAYNAEVTEETPVEEAPVEAPKTRRGRR